MKIPATMLPLSTTMMPVPVAVVDPQQTMQVSCSRRRLEDTTTHLFWATTTTTRCR
jgi:hypothetical protein